MSISFDDYKLVKGGLKYPYSIKQVVGPQNMDMKVESIELNTSVDDKIFEIKK
jgi:zinc protease